MGSNGSKEKSTLLKLIARLPNPHTEKSLIRGEVSTLLDLGVGFIRNWQTRKDIKMNCSILGVPSQNIEQLTHRSLPLVNWSNFIDYPVRTYSAGMCLRLGFAIASHVPSDILLIDEVLTVGDQYFQRKCVQKNCLLFRRRANHCFGFS